jgi:hypothetical protein
MILLSQKLPHLAEGMAVARHTLAIIRQNLAWAVVYNLLAIPAAAASLHGDDFRLGHGDSLPPGSARRDPGRRDRVGVFMVHPGRAVR